MNATTNIATDLLTLREANNLTQEQAGRRARISSQYLCMIETGTRVPTIAVLLRLLDVYDAKLSIVLRK